MREVTNSGNIGSIITMLIDEQHVNIEDILTEEQFRQDCQHQTETKIKEEVESGALTDFGSSNYHDFPFSSVSQNYRAADTPVWSSGASMVTTAHTDHSEVQSGLEKGGEPGLSRPDLETDSFQSCVQNLLTVPSVATNSRQLPCLAANTPANSVRDDKYWERRRSNIHTWDQTLIRESIVKP